MSNIVHLFADRTDAQQGPAPTGLAETSTREQPDARPRWAAALRVVGFLVLYWLRLPVAVVCRLVYLPCLLGLLIGLVVAREHTQALWVLGTVSFAAFVGQWLYDRLLVALAPYDVAQQL